MHPILKYATIRLCLDWKANRFRFAEPRELTRTVAVLVDLNTPQSSAPGLLLIEYPRHRHTSASSRNSGRKPQRCIAGRWQSRRLKTLDYRCRIQYPVQNRDRERRNRIAPAQDTRKQLARQGCRAAGEMVKLQSIRDRLLKINATTLHGSKGRKGVELLKLHRASTRGATKQILHAETSSGHPNQRMGLKRGHIPFIAANTVAIEGVSTVFLCEQTDQSLALRQTNISVQYTRTCS